MLRKALPPLFFLIVFCASADYCTKRFQRAVGVDITRVRLNTIDRNQEEDSNPWDGYVNTGLVTNLEPGETYTLTINHASSQKLGVYIDWNGDEDFNDVSEIVFQSGGGFTGSQSNIDITVPNDAARGVTRMRIVLAWNATSNYGACGTSGFGDAEDYSLMIVGNYYSRTSASWDDNSTWSYERIGGAACNCIPNEDGSVFIGGGHNITLSSDAAVNEVFIENTGTLSYSLGNTELALGETLQVESGAMLDRNNQENTSLRFTAVSNFNIADGATVNIGGVVVDATAQTTINRLGLAGTAQIVSNGDVSLSSDATLSVSQNVSFEFQVLNAGTEAFLYNSGTLIQNGDFQTIAPDASLINQANATWEWGGVNYDSDIGSTLNLSAADNSFAYIFDGDQNILPVTHRNLLVKSPGTKSLTAITYVNDNLIFEDGIIALGDFSFFVRNISTTASSQYIQTNGTGTFALFNTTTGLKNIPLGSETGSLGNLIIDVQSVPIVFYIRLLSDVYTEGSEGVIETREVVDLTWEIRSNFSNYSANITFQWYESEEMPGFARNDFTIAEYETDDWTDITPAAVDISGEPYSANANMVLGSTKYFVIKNTSTLLPITLDYFTADLEEGKVVLNWRTLTESNNDYFTLEKSIDNSPWETVAMADGAGTSNDPIQYRSVDDYPYPGVSFYRLKQTDFDGQFAYSEVVRLEYTDGNNLEPVTFPNPASNFVRITGITDVSNLYVVDLNGKRHEVDYNLHSNNPTSVQVNISGLDAGIYFIVTPSHKVRISKK